MEETYEIMVDPEALTLYFGQGAEDKGKHTQMLRQT